MNDGRPFRRTCAVCRERPPARRARHPVCARCRPGFEAVLAHLARGRTFYRVDRFGVECGGHRLPFEACLVANVRGEGLSAEVRFEGRARFIPMIRLCAEAFNGEMWFVDEARARAEALSAIGQRIGELRRQHDEIRRQED